MSKGKRLLYIFCTILIAWVISYASFTACNLPELPEVPVIQLPELTELVLETIHGLSPPVVVSSGTSGSSGRLQAVKLA